jgi:membrane protein
VTTLSRKRRLGDLVGIWVDLFKRHNLLTYASAIAFQALVALVALALLLFATLSEIGRSDVWKKQLGPHIEPKVLHDVFLGLNATFEKVFHTSSAGLVAFAAVVTIWEISGLIRACMGALSVVYGHREDRPWWIRFPISLGLALLFTAAIFGSFLLATVAKSAVGGSWGLPFSILRWLLAVALIWLAFGALVRWAPAEARTTKWASGGAALVVVAWLAESLIFSEYLRYLADYRTAAGCLLGVYLITTYLYVGSIILLVAIELDELLRKDLQGKQERGILQLVKEIVVSG